MRALSVFFVLAIVGCGSSDSSGAPAGAAGSASSNGGGSSGSADAGAGGSSDAGAGGGDDAAGAGGAPCDGTSTCTGGNRVTTCTMVDGAPQTSMAMCSVGQCKNGECGACTTADDCAGGMVQCACTDGTNQELAIANPTCSMGACEFTADCDVACANNGGSKPE